MCKANDEAKDFLWRFCAERKGVQTLVCNSAGKATGNKEKPLIGFGLCSKKAAKAAFLCLLFLYC
jgi:hypothetical protein